MADFELKGCHILVWGSVLECPGEPDPKAPCHLLCRYMGLKEFTIVTIASGAISMGCVCRYTYVYIYIYMHIYKDVHMYKHAYTCKSRQMNTHVYMHMYTFTYTRMYILTYSTHSISRFLLHLQIGSMACMYLRPTRTSLAPQIASPNGHSLHTW